MQNFDHNIGFLEKRQFFAENCRKSQNIVIITSTPGLLGGVFRISAVFAGLTSGGTEDVHVRQSLFSIPRS
jgi:hypothetical protein